MSCCLYCAAFSTRRRLVVLKVILMLDCNICGQPFDRVVTTCNRDPLFWKSLSLDLEDTAVNSGCWSFYRSAHYCDYCMSDMELFWLRQKEDATCSK